MAVAVSLSCVTIGAILSTAVLIGPADDRVAADETARPGRAVGRAPSAWRVTWLGILLAYDSYYWPPQGKGWPVSFFVVALILVAYLLADLSRPEIETPGVRAACGEITRHCRSRPLRRRGQSDVLRLHDQCLDRRDDGRRRRRRRGLLHRAEGLGLRGPCGPHRPGFAGAAGASLLGISTYAGLGAFAVLSAVAIGLLGKRGRHDAMTALALVFMLGLGALFSELELAVRLGDLCPALRRSARGEQQPGARDRRARRRVHLVRRGHVPPAVVDLGGAAGSRSAWNKRAVDGDVLPRHRGGGHDDVGAGRRCPVDVQPDDRCPGCRPGPHQEARSPPSAFPSAISMLIVWIAIAAAYETDWPIGFFVGVLGAAFFLVREALGGLAALPGGPVGDGTVATGAGADRSCGTGSGPSAGPGLMSARRGGPSLGARGRQPPAGREWTSATRTCGGSWSRPWRPPAVR